MSVIANGAQLSINNTDNTPPNPPEISGPTSGNVGEYYTYNFYLTDPDEHPMELLQIDWNEGDIEEYDPQGCDCGSFWNSGDTVPIDNM